jgi:hypothetical protein
LSEIVTLNEKITSLSLLTDVLNTTIRRQVEHLAWLQAPLANQQEAKSNKYCLYNSCFTLAEFALFGTGAFIAGILAIVLVS